MTVQDRYLSKPERSEFEELIAELRGQHNLSWTDLSSAAGYTGPGGAKQAHVSHYTNVRVSNLIALRRYKHDLHRKGHKHNGATEKVWDGTAGPGTTLRHSLSEKKVEEKKPVEVKAATTRTPPPAWFLAQQRSDLTKEQKEEFKLLADKALALGFTYSEIGLRIGYKTGYGLQRTLEAGVQSYVSNLLQLREFIKQVDAGEIKPTGGVSRTHVPKVAMSGAERKRMEAYFQWLKRCGYGATHVAFAAGHRTAHKKVRDLYKAHYATMHAHILRRGEDPDAIVAWYANNGPMPKQNKDYPAPLVQDTVLGGGETRRFKDPAPPEPPATLTEAVFVDAPVILAPARVELTLPQAGSPAMNTLAVLEEMSKIKDGLVRQSEQLGNLVARLDELMTAGKCPPFLKTALGGARIAVAQVNDKLIGTISDYFEG